MSTLTERERELYEHVWTDIDTYGEIAPGLTFLDLVREVVPPGAHVLDAGCGTGKVGVALAEAGYEVTLADLTPMGLVPEAKALPFLTQCLWKPISGAWDWAVCFDVLEHLPEHLAILAAARLLGAVREGLVLSIATIPDAHGFWAGRQLHQTVESFVWWRDALREIGTVTDARDLLASGLYVVRPR